jgi:ATP/maltotriose-dependent transcriptional regulator MalT
VVGDGAAARTEAERALHFAPRRGAIRAQALIALATASLLTGDVPPALAATAEARQIADESGLLWSDLPLLDLAEAEALERSGEAARAASILAAGRSRLLAWAAELDAADPPGAAGERSLARVPEHARLLSVSGGGRAEEREDAPP